jgi:plasmid stabilization system protein ParE
MSAHKSDDFISDVEHQFEWYAANAGWDIAERYLDAVEATCQLLGRHPRLGPCAGFSHPRLRD